MIIFAVTTDVEFIGKPEWLDTFFIKHNKVKYDFHVTLKQSCVIEKKQVSKIKNALSEYFEQEEPKQIDIVFDRLNSDASVDDLSKNDGTIMINSDNESVMNLQRAIVELLSDYKNFLIQETKNYQEKFKPHITIATGLNQEQFESAKKDLREDYLCQAKLIKVILIIIYNFKQETERREEVA